MQSDKDEEQSDKDEEQSDKDEEQSDKDEELIEENQPDNLEERMNGTTVSSNHTGNLIRIN